MNIVFQNTFYIVRHGEAENNVLGIESCKIDTQKKYGLTDRGKDTVANEAENYRDFDFIYCSPFRRTQETASYFANSSQCNITLDNRLVDIDLGNLDEQPYNVSNATIENKDNFYIYPNGESFTQVLDRLVDFLNDVNSKHTKKKILIVSHGFPCEALLDWVHGKPLKDWDKCIEKGKVFPLAIS